MCSTAGSAALTSDLCRASRDEQGPRARRENWYVASLSWLGGVRGSARAWTEGPCGHSRLSRPVQGQAGELGEAGPSGEPGIPVSVPNFPPPAPLPPPSTTPADTRAPLSPCREMLACLGSVERLATGARR